MQVITGYLVNGANPVTIGGLGTGIKYFPSVPGPSIGVTRTTPSATSSIGQLKLPGQNRLNGQLFRVDAVGYVVTDGAIACPQVTIALYAQTNQQIDGHNPTYTSIAQFTAAAQGNVLAEPFRVTAHLSGDSVSGILQGSQEAIYNGVFDDTSPTALENNLSGINFNANVPFGLVVGVTFSVTGANNSANLTQFTVSA